MCVCVCIFFKHLTIFNVFHSLGDGVTYPQRCVDEDTDDLLGARQRWADDEENEMMCTGYANNHAHG